MASEKKIKYLDYLVHGERMKGAGFLRLERKNSRCNFAIQINGMEEGCKQSQEKLPLRILLGDGHREVEFAHLALQGGNARGNFSGMNPENLLGTGISYDDLRTLRVPLGQNREIVCVISDNKEDEVSYVAQVQAAEGRETQDRESERRESQDRESEGWGTQDRESRGWKSQDREAGRREPQDRESEEWEIQGRESKRERIQREAQSTDDMEGKGDRRRQNMPAKEDKWMQLQAIYPHITPFQDDREYLSIGPNDFVILSEKYYGLIHNSFLLHGYYNYQHLILQRVVKKGETKYYIGVPGNFYDREKQVAVMFGFESFESLEEPAREGDYGYYMISVDL